MLVLLCETWTEYDVSQKVDVDCEALERCGWKKEEGRRKKLEGENLSGGR